MPLDFNFDVALRVCSGGVVGHRQVTDAWLLAAAVRAGMKLVTFDGGVAALLNTDAERNAHLVVLH